MEITSIKTPIYSKPDKSEIDCIITCQYGELSFTATSHDKENHGKQIFDDLIAEKYGEIAEYVG